MRGSETQPGVLDLVELGLIYLSGGMVDLGLLGGQGGHAGS
jgi:hypothetical protein